MAAAVTLLGIELIVDDLDRAVALWIDVLGFDLVQRGEPTAVAGEAAIVTDGRVVVTLLAPAGGGPGHLLTDRSPRLSQIVLDAITPAAHAIGDAATEAGLSVVPTASGFYLGPEAVAGALGAEIAIVVTNTADADPNAVEHDR